MLGGAAARQSQAVGVLRVVPSIFGMAGRDTSPAPMGVGGGYAEQGPYQKTTTKGLTGILARRKTVVAGEPVRFANGFSLLPCSLVGESRVDETGSGELVSSFCELAMERRRVLSARRFPSGG